jgi:hypothetical protein
MAQLPLPVSPGPIWTKWKTLIDTLLGNPLNSVQILEGVELASGNTVINHKLGRLQQGWYLLDVNGAATIYRSAALNSKTLTLNSSAAVTVNIGVY